MPGPDLSPPTRQRLEALFTGEQRNRAAQLLIDECGTNLPFCENDDAQQLERIRFAALKQSDGSIGGLRSAIELARTDWRDLLMAAGFGEDITAHAKWFPEPMATE